MKKILFVLEKFNESYALIMKNLENDFKIHVLSNDSKFDVLQVKNKIVLESIPDIKVNRTNNYLPKIILEYRVTKKIKQKSISIIKQISPDLIFLSKDSTLLGYFISKNSVVPIVSMQLTLYTKESILNKYISTPVSVKHHIYFLIAKLFPKWLPYYYKKKILLPKGDLTTFFARRLAGYDNKAISRGGNSSFFCVNGSAFVSLYSDLGLNREKLLPIGNPVYSKIHKTKLTKTEIEVGEFKPLDISDEKEIKVTCFLAPYYFYQKKGYNLLEEAEFIANTIHKYAQHRIKLIFKTHPGDNYNGHTASPLKVLTKFKNTFVIESKGYEDEKLNNQLILASKYIILSVSSIGINSVILNKPLITYPLFFQSDRETHFFRDEGVSLHTSTKEEFEQLIRKINSVPETLSTPLKNYEAFLKKWAVSDEDILKRYKLLVKSILENK